MLLLRETSPPPSKTDPPTQEPESSYTRTAVLIAGGPVQVREASNRKKGGSTDFISHTCPYSHLFILTLHALNS